MNLILVVLNLKKKKDKWIINEVSKMSSRV